MVRVYWDILFDFDFVHTLQDGQPMSYAGDSHFLQLIMF